MANELLNPVVIGKEILMRLENKFVMFKMVNRDYDDRFAVPDEKIGYTFNVRIPVRFRGRRGDELQPEDIRETLVPITVNKLWGSDLSISDQDLTMTIDRFGERYGDSQADTIAQMIDGDLFDEYANVSNLNTPCTPGVTPTSRLTYTSGKVVLANCAVPLSGLLNTVVSPEMEQQAIEMGALQFNPAKTISEQYLTGNMGLALGQKFSMAQNVTRHVVGNCTGCTPLVNGAGQTGANIVTNGWTNNTQVLNKGDIVKFAGVNRANPLSYRDTGQLISFRVTADVVSDGAGNATIPIGPDVNIGAGGDVFQTVTASPANGAAVYIYNAAAGAAMNAISGVSSPQALTFHRDAFTFVCVPMELPGGMDWSERVSNPKIGISMRLTRGFDIGKNRRYTRLDVLGGIKTTRPDWATRIAA